MIPNREFKLSELSLMNSSASEIDDTVNKIKNNLFKQSGNSSYEFVGITANGTNSEYVDTYVNINFKKNFTLSFVAENKGLESAYKAYQFGVQELSNYFKAGYYADATTVTGYMTYSVGGVNFSIIKTIPTTQKTFNMIIVNNTETKTIGMSINGEDFAYVNVTAYGDINMPFKLGTVNKNGIADGFGINVSSFCLYPISFNINMIRNSYLYFLDTWNTDSYSKKSILNYSMIETYYNVLNNISYGVFNYIKEKQYIINMLNISKNRAIIGDSISHGETTTSRKDKSYANLLKKYMNVTDGTLNFGYETIPQSPSLSDGSIFHAVTYTGFVFDTRAADYSLSGSCLTGGSASEVIFTISKANNQNFFKVNYVKHISANYSCAVYVNGTLVGTDTISFSSAKECTVGSTYSLAGDNSIIKVVVTSGTASVFGITYYNNILDPVLNTYCQPARKLVDTKNIIIDTLCSQNKVIFWALGYNDRLNTSDQTTIYAFLDRLRDKAIENDCCIIFLDFNWMEAETNFIKTKFVTTAKELGERGMYINFMDNLRVDGRKVDTTYLTTTLGAWTEAAHPNDFGHRLLFNIIKKQMFL